MLRLNMPQCTLTFTCVIFGIDVGGLYDLTSVATLIPTRVVQPGTILGSHDTFVELLIKPWAMSL